MNSNRRIPFRILYNFLLIPSVSVRRLNFPVGIVRKSCDDSTLKSLVCQPFHHLAVILANTGRFGRVIMADKEYSFIKWLFFIVCQRIILSNQSAIFRMFSKPLLQLIYFYRNCPHVCNHTPCSSICQPGRLQ